MQRARSTRYGRLAGLFSVTGAAIVSLALLAPTLAEGYGHRQLCTKAAYAGCYDVQGVIYNPWRVVDAGANPDFAYVNGMCAKAVTQAGNVRSGSGCNSSDFRISYIDGAYPTSQAYGYFGGSGTTVVAVHANT